MNNRSQSHHDRYAKLRHKRQKLHKDILALLREEDKRKVDLKTILGLQLDLATVDAGIDDCVSKLAALERKRARVLEAMLPRQEIDASLSSATSRVEAVGGGGSDGTKALTKRTPANMCLSISSVMDFLDSSEDNE